MVRQLTHGGCERDLARLALGLRGGPFEPRVACFRPGGIRYDELRAAGMDVDDIGLRSLASPGAAGGAAAAWRLARDARRHGIRLLHAMDAPAAYFAAPVCRLAGVPAILTCQLSYRDLVSPFERRLLRVADRASDRVVANCQAVREDLIANYGVPAAKTALVYNGVELERFHPPAGGGRDRSPLPESFRAARLVIGSVCALRPEKGLDILIDAFARLRPADSGARLAIVGSGPMLEAWRGRAAAAGVAAYVHFEPSTPRPEVWMRGFDVAALTSRSESFPNGLLEAMACGAAPAGARIGGVPEMIGDDRWLFPPGDAAALARLLERLAADPAETARLGAAAARRAAEKFSLAENLRVTSALYQQTLAERGIAAG